MTGFRGIAVLGAAAVFAFAAPAGAQEIQRIVVDSPTMRPFEAMPRDYSPDGRNLSPPLVWSNLPQGTRQIVVMCEDHGAGNPPPWVHWLIYNIPGNATGLPEGLPIDSRTPMPAQLAGAVQGANGWGLPMYRGPAPPLGNTNHYRFVVIALDAELNLSPGLNRAQVLEAIEGHVIGEGEMVPIYQRQPMDSPAHQL
jgi:Raf kinase inhibitor-like YbhB/YbcL family protein